jgi:hypothetical protein
MKLVDIVPCYLIIDSKNKKKGVACLSLEGTPVIVPIRCLTSDSNLIKTTQPGSEALIKKYFAKSTTKWSVIKIKITSDYKVTIIPE